MGIFDRFDSLIRTILDDDGTRTRESPPFADPDERLAWEELESYMRGEHQQGTTTSSTGRRSEMPASLRRDFRNLEVRVGAPFPEVQRNYKRLMAAFHPDRHSSDPVRLQTATEVTKKLNQSFQRIRAYYEGGA